MKNYNQKNKKHALYVHIPFCERKCLYCSFVVSIGQEHKAKQYVDALREEARYYRGTRCATVYLGGGTPSRMERKHLSELIAMVRDTFIVDEDCEWTIEMNPEDCTAELCVSLREAGFNRVSLGVQTWNDRWLKFLGRVHDAEKARGAFRLLRAAGFDNISCDLMFGFPGQSMEELNDDLHEMTRVAPEHVSCYGLTVDPHSRFFATNLELPDGDIQAEMYRRICVALDRGGWAQYEISNFCREGFASRHNLSYWTGEDYIGLGIGAHSFLNGARKWNVTTLRDYFSRQEQGENAEAGREEIDAQKRFLERLVFGLRMNRGINLAALEQEAGMRLDEERRRTLQVLIDEKYLVREADTIRTEMKGRLVLDDISARLI